MKYTVLLLAFPLFISSASALNSLMSDRVAIVFASKTATDRVAEIGWKNSDGGGVTDYVVAGGSVNCDDPQEFFGQSYGDADGTSLLMVVQGTKGKWTQADNTHGTSKTSGKDACATLSGKTATNYTLSNAKATENTVKIERIFNFSDAAQSLNNNLRAYAPRLPNSKYQTVYYADAGGAVQSFNIFSCPTAASCTITNWDGKWFADDDGQGNGMMVIRDKSSKAPAQIEGDFDSFSSSNVTSIILVKPAGGWTGKVKETEYLCFYDAKSWPTASRNAGKLPKGCSVR